MKKQEKIHWFSVLSLVLFCFSAGLRVVHHLFLHQHDDREICQDFQHDEKTTHLHDERYQPEKCEVCAFIFSIPEFVSISALVFRESKLADSLKIEAQKTCVPSEVDSIYLRGPPMI